MTQFPARSVREPRIAAVRRHWGDRRAEHRRTPLQRRSRASLTVALMTHGAPMRLIQDVPT
eukprot:700548-Hanusia_phi.AAC.1